MRKALELVITAWPALANFGSNSLAMAASKAAKITFGAPSGEASDTGIFATRSGIGVFSFQRAASAYGRPAERSEAANHATSNQGCCSSNWMNLWPTIPVAPRIPMGIFFGIFLNFLH